jgi:hypothetical protein
MALFNRTDGTLYSFDTVQEMLENRFMKNEWANVSDILGSDWAVTRNPRTSEDYQAAAFAVARLVYARSIE